MREKGENKREGCQRTQKKNAQCTYIMENANPMKSVDSNSIEMFHVVASQGVSEEVRNMTQLESKSKNISVSPIRYIFISSGCCLAMKTTTPTIPPYLCLLFSFFFLLSNSRWIKPNCREPDDGAN